MSSQKNRILSDETGKAADGGKDLKVWVAAASDAEPVRKIFPDQGAILAVGDIEALERAAQAGGRLVAVFQEPQDALALAMQNEQPPFEALNQWCGTARAVRDIQARNRRAIVLVSGRRARQAPDALRGHLKLPAAAAPDLGAAPADPVLQVMAAQVLEQDFAAKILAGELEAGAIRLAGPGPDGAEVIDAALRSYRDLHRTGAEAEERASRFAAEVDLLSRQLAAVNQDLVPHDELAEAKKQNDALHVALQQKEIALAGLEHHKAQLEHETAELQALLHGIASSRSHRMMEPLRQVRAAMLRRKSKE